MLNQKLEQYATQLKIELTTDILPFYLRIIDDTHGGFLGMVDQSGVHAQAQKGLVQHSRLLWTYSQAYNVLGDETYRRAAKHAYQFLAALFDESRGGFYWLTDYRGQPVDHRKFTYGQAFALYGLSEYYRATGDKTVLTQAIALFEWIEAHLKDATFGGYREGLNPDGSRFDESISIDQVTAAKTMNTHLHLLEAYTNLLRIWPNGSLQQALKDLIQLTVTHIINSDTGHFKLHFSANWQSLNERISYGHDIEGSWLLLEAAEILADEQVSANIMPLVLKMAQATLTEGVNHDGSLRDENHSDDKVWWGQAEAMVGFLNAWQLTAERRYLDASLNCWAYVQTALIDRDQGEWFSGRTADGSLMTDPKAGIWKTPYHNGRACMEVMARVKKALSTPTL